MAHRHHRFLRALLGGAVQHRIQERDQRRDPFQRKPLCSQITLLDDLLKDVRLDQQVESALRI